MIAQWLWLNTSCQLLYVKYRITESQCDTKQKICHFAVRARSQQSLPAKYYLAPSDLPCAFGDNASVTAIADRI